ncbi:MAG TPA: response regulator [Vicinamibacteria bacterium]|jgi:CheY-like chemotaxis protein
MTTPPKKSVLIVDDDKLIRTMFDRFLSAFYEVRLAVHGGLAVEEVKRQPPDLIILDLRMPVMDGWQVLQWLETIEPRIPVIVISAETRGPAIASSLVRSRLTKPIPLKLLREACEAALGGPASGGPVP